MATKPKDISHAVFNKNPGNIKHSVGGKELDYLKVLDRLGIKYSKGSKAKDGGYFIKFESDEDGYKAAKTWWPTVKNWAVYKGLTLDKALEKYSGEGYDAKKLGLNLDGDKLLSEFSDEELGGIMSKQIQMEDPKQYKILQDKGLLSEEEFPGLIKEVEIEEKSVETEQKEASEKDKTKYRKEVLERISGRKEYLKYLEDNQSNFKELASLEKNLSLLSQGKDYNKAAKRKATLEEELRKKESALREQLYKKELNNYVNSENNSRAELSRLENELKSYLNANQSVPQDLTNQINKARQDIKESGNRVKLLTKEGWKNYNISPVQQGYNQNILNLDGTINEEESKTTPVLPDPLGDEEQSYNIVDENTDQTQIPEEAVVEEVVPEEIVPEEVIEEVVPEEVVTPEGDGTEPPSRLQQAGSIGESLLKGSAAVLDQLGGPNAIVSYIMGKKGLKAAMEEIKPMSRPELSPMFMQHLRQTKELSKKGFHPSEEMKFRKELDKSYKIGLENAVRGSGGSRARYLAQSGVLDAQRSSALLDYAVKDDELQRKNAEKYEKLMLFKENFDLERTEKERLEDMERQEKRKDAAINFTSAAFTNAMSGLSGTSFSGIVDAFTSGRKKDSNTDLNVYDPVTGELIK